MNTPRLTLVLPYPPSVNRYWRRAGTHVHISDEGRAYRGKVQAAAGLVWDEGLAYRGKVQVAAGFGWAPLTGPLAVEIDVRPPDRRRRDLDNVLKALLDSLQHAGVYADDYQIARLTVNRREPLPGGLAYVALYTLENAACAPASVAVP